MKPVIFKFSGVKFSVERNVAVHIDSDGNLSFDEDNIGGIVWPKSTKYNASDVLGGFGRGEVARDIIPDNFPIGEVRKVYANNDSTIRHAAYRFDMKLKIGLSQVKKGGKRLFTVERVA
jgi:hypothetical protein